MPQGVSHAALVERAARWLTSRHRCQLVLAEWAGGLTGQVPDAIGWRHGHHSVLVEVKVSRSDFAADSRKLSHRAGSVLGAERWYLTPQGLVAYEEVPDPWGLAEIHGSQVRIVKPADGSWLYPAGRLLVEDPETQARRLRYETSALVAALGRLTLGDGIGPLARSLRPGARDVTVLNVLAGLQ